MEDLLKVGVITTTHGVRGEVKVFPTTDEAERFLELDYVLLDTGRELRRLEIQNVKFIKGRGDYDHPRCSRRSKGFSDNR